MVEQGKKELLEVLIQDAAQFNISKLVCETSHGTFMVDIRDKEIGQSLMVHGEFEYMEKCAWFEYIAGGSNKVFIDIGANIGTTTVPLLLDNYVGKVIAFEPDPNNFHMLSYNIASNNLQDRVVAHQCAISNACGNVRFELSRNNFGDHRVRYQDIPTGSYGEALRSTIEVPCMTLDEMMNRCAIDLSSIAAIKSDTQGSEGYVLEGATNALKARIPWIIEFWPYGIQRSGFNQNRFVSIVACAFSSFIEFKPGASVRHRPISEFNQLFTGYTGTSFCNIILIPN